MRPILRWPDPVLSTVCTPVRPGEDMTDLAMDMLDTMYAAPGRGLAAPQIGVSRRVFVMDCTWKEGPGTPMILINPHVLAVSDTLVAGDEGCLSIPGITTAVARPDWVEMAWTARDGSEMSQRFEGFEAICAQHELDHLDGIVTFQRMDPVARAEAEAQYLGTAA